MFVCCRCYYCWCCLKVSVAFVFIRDSKCRANCNKTVHLFYKQGLSRWVGLSPKTGGKRERERLTPPGSSSCCAERSVRRFRHTRTQRHTNKHSTQIHTHRSTHDPETHVQELGTEEEREDRMGHKGALIVALTLLSCCTRTQTQVGPGGGTPAL